MNEDDLRPFLGPPRFTVRSGRAHRETGVATGLAWTSVGGEILFIEATRMHGRASCSSPASSATS
jgi:ATP-dependent Lon protease